LFSVPPFWIIYCTDASKFSERAESNHNATVWDWGRGCSAQNSEVWARSTLSHYLITNNTHALTDLYLPRCCCWWWWWLNLRMFPYPVYHKIHKGMGGGTDLDPACNLNSDVVRWHHVSVKLQSMWAGVLTDQFNWNVLLHHIWEAEPLSSPHALVMALQPRRSTSSPSWELQISCIHFKITAFWNWYNILMYMLPLGRFVRTDFLGTLWLQEHPIVLANK
jgi:hypothetical protein